MAFPPCRRCLSHSGAACRSGRRVNARTLTSLRRERRARRLQAKPDVTLHLAQGRDGCFSPKHGSACRPACARRSSQLPSRSAINPAAAAYTPSPRRVTYFTAHMVDVQAGAIRISSTPAQKHFASGKLPAFCVDHQPGDHARAHRAWLSHRYLLHREVEILCDDRKGDVALGQPSG